MSGDSFDPDKYMFGNISYSFGLLNALSDRPRQAYTTLVYMGMDRPLVRDFLNELYKEAYTKCKDMIEKGVDSRGEPVDYSLPGWPSSLKRVVSTATPPDTYANNETLWNECDAAKFPMVFSWKTCRKPFVTETGMPIEKGTIYYSWRWNGIRHSKYQPDVPVARTPK